MPSLSIIKASLNIPEYYYPLHYILSSEKSSTNESFLVQIQGNYTNIFVNPYNHF